MTLPIPRAVREFVDDGELKWPMRPNLSQYIPRIEHGPQFVYETAEQQWARTWLNMAFRGDLSGRFSWRDPGIRWHLRALLDPTYRHPKAKRHA